MKQRHYTIKVFMDGQVIVANCGRTANNALEAVELALDAGTLVLPKDVPCAIQVTRPDGIAVKFTMGRFG